MMLPEDGDGSQLTPMDIRDWANPEECDPHRRKRCLITGGSLLSVILVIAISAVAVRNNRRPQYAPVAPEHEDVYNLVKSLYIGHELPTEDILRVGGYQHKAFSWLTEDPDMQSIPHERKIQRFALACFFFATNNVPTKHNKNPGPWLDDHHWVSGEHECDWPGIVCTDDAHVQSINLEHNNLSGKIPFEIGMIWEHLKVIELSFNEITMEGDDWNVFLHLSRLEKLALSSNHVFSNSGVPGQLLKSKYLRKLLLSDNKIKGPVNNGVLDNMHKMTHLELEYNALTGDIALLGDLPKLEQVYLRHNDLHSNLSFLQSDSLTNLLSIWLDGNKIVSTIPTEIGNLSTLQSISISDTKITGTIPSEIGRLTHLQRLWLYKNHLSGTIPSELENLSHLELLKLEENNLSGSIPSKVCKTIDHSAYEKSGVAADCNKVECECCTECF